MSDLNMRSAAVRRTVHGVIDINPAHDCSMLVKVTRVQLFLIKMPEIILYNFLLLLVEHGRIHNLVIHGRMSYKDTEPYMSAFL
jgi:hypothetical protein